jgi:hypothetical protein
MSRTRTPPLIYSIVCLYFLAWVSIVHAAVYNIKSTSSDLFICADSATPFATIILGTNNQMQDDEGSYLCYWSFDTIGRIHFSGGNGDLLITAADHLVCSSQTYTLSIPTDNHTQSFGWVNSPYGEGLVTAGGYGNCAMDTLNQTEGSSIRSTEQGSSNTQSFALIHLTCSQGQYWNQDLTSPRCLPCPQGRLVHCYSFSSYINKLSLL